MKQFKFKQLFILSLFATMFFACSNDDDATAEPENEEEVITTAVLTISNEGSSVGTFRYRVQEGQVVEQDEINLGANTTYNVDVSFLNEEETPSEDITAEVLEEAEEHLICFMESTGLDLTVNRTDLDNNGFELGLESEWITGEAGSGSLEVNLRHQPDLKEDQSSENCNIGETDIQATFNVFIR